MSYAGINLLLLFMASNMPLNEHPKVSIRALAFTILTNVG